MIITNFNLVDLLLNPLKSSIHVHTILAAMEGYVLLLKIPSLNASAPRATLEIVAKMVRRLISVHDLMILKKVAYQRDIP